jgi:hypothetical protein
VRLGGKQDVTTEQHWASSGGKENKHSKYSKIDLWYWLYSTVIVPLIINCTLNE